MTARPLRTADDLPIFQPLPWQMMFGERAALEGVLSQLRPRLSIETGTAQGGSLHRLAAHSEHVHAFDIVPEVKELEGEFDNVTVHIGDSSVELPRVLAKLAGDGRHVDFALIDGDHTAEGVRRDVDAVLASDACRHTVVLLHDTANDDVRRGLEGMGLPARNKVAVCMLDFVPGYLVRKGHEIYSLAAWNGLGLLILDPVRGAEPAQTMSDHYSVAEIYQRIRPDYAAD